MKASAISSALKTLIVAQQPTFIWGPPGIGKSSVVRQLAHELGLALQDIRALLLDPVDIRGLPYLGPDGRSKWAAPDFLPSDGAQPMKGAPPADRQERLLAKLAGVEKSVHFG